MLFFIDNQEFIGFFAQTKLSSIYRRTFLCLDEALRVACNQAKLKLDMCY